MLAVARNYYPKIRKKKTLAEKVKAAQENRFNNNITSIDNRHILREILPYINSAYKTQIEL